jgi:outer membrane protein OmpA-like peptidoglycan-associated protein
MFNIHDVSRRGLICSALAAVLVLGAGAGSVRAEDPTEQDIVKALTPKPLTRGLSVSPADAAKKADEQKFLDDIKSRPTRSLSSNEREQIATIAADKPSIDLTINFDYNSANIAPSAAGAVTALGKALSNPDLKGSTFLVAGYTDAKGGDQFNQQLSERRAETIKKVLAAKYGVSAESLVTVGYGKTKLKNQSDPFAAENRRVQVVNMAK